MISVKAKGVELILNKDSLSFSFQTKGGIWKFRQESPARMECEEGTIHFANASVITHEEIEFGLGKGIQSHYEGFVVNEKEIPFAFDTIAWVEESTGNVYFEWIPLCEEGLHIKKLYWPGEMEFDERKDSWYTLINAQQGLMIPNTWKVEKSPISFDGYFGTAGGYMPWIAQVKDRVGYIAICTTPWNGGYYVEHPAKGPYTHTGMYFDPSLGKMDYRRVVRYTFRDDCDYNDLCKIYRMYVKEQGTLKTLAEKAAKNPSIDRLIGCAFIHKGIKTYVRSDSDFYDEDNPGKNNHLTTFKTREEEMKQLHELGVEKVYLHLDGWAEPGYDNMHPDYYPACEKAGGWEDMKSLADTMQQLGYLFGIHDQYRDYYLAAESYDERYACHLPDGSIPAHKRWAGGPQNYLCGTQAPFYVKRNFERLFEHGIHMDCAYLDVFTCNEGDECASPYHRMTRKECYDFRNQCFEYLLAHDILPSSEEVSDWSVKSLVFSHYAPYDFMLREPGTEKQGIPVPLFNLVYHDCMIEPWMMEKINGGEDYMLYALLNGGVPYLLRDGAYPNFDGSFEGKNVEFSLEETIKRCKVVSDLHEKVAKCEMIRHEMVDGNAQIQRTVFSNGVAVTVDFEKGEYCIETV